MTENEKKAPKFAMDFVGFASMGSVGVEASIALTPEWDLKSVSSTYVHKDGSRVITLFFGKSDKKLGRKGYSLKEEWSQEPKGEVQFIVKEKQGETQ